MGRGRGRGRGRGKSRAHSPPFPLYYSQFLYVGSCIHLRRFPNTLCLLASAQAPAPASIQVSIGGIEYLSSAMASLNTAALCLGLLCASIAAAAALPLGKPGVKGGGCVCVCASCK